MLLINIMQSLKESFIIFDRQLLINFGDFIILIFDDVWCEFKCLNELHIASIEAGSLHHIEFVAG